MAISQLQIEAHRSVAADALAVLYYSKDQSDEECVEIT